MVSSVGNILDAIQQRQLIALRKTARTLDARQQQLATGREVNSAIDNPQNFFAAQSLQNRASDISRRLDGIAQSIRVLQETQIGLDAAFKTIDQAESYLVDIIDRVNAGELTFDVIPDTSAPANVTQIRPAAGDFLGYAGGQDTGGPVTVTNGGEDFVITGNLWKRVAINYTVTADTVLEFNYRSTTIPEIAAIGFDNDVNFGNDNDRFFLYGTQLGGISYSAPTATYQYDGSGDFVHVEIPIGTFFTGNFSHITFINDDDSTPTGESEYNDVFLREGPIVFNDTTAEPEGLREGYEEILSQLDFITNDAQYRGFNLLRDEDLTTHFNENLSSKLVTEGIDATSDGLGLVSSVFNSLEVIETKLEQVRRAREILREYNSSIAVDLNIIQNRADFTRITINTLLAGGDDLVLDDQNETGAELLALQTRQQVQFNVLATSRDASIASFI